MTSEKFCLRWNDFESNISVAFRELRDDKDFFDVTLACEDEQLQAHKVILSACSPFFRNVLRRNPHATPLIYLKGVKYSDLQSVLNFMYHGEVNVAQEELNSFLAVAEDLRVKGLTQNQGGGSSGGPQSIPKSSYPSSRSPPPKPAPRLPERETTPSLPKKSRISIPLPISAPTNHQTDDDDIQEVIPVVKSEPREAAPPPPAPVPQLQPQLYHAPEQVESHALAPTDDSDLAGYGGEDDGGYEDYGQYETGEQGYDNSFTAVDGSKGPTLSPSNDLEGQIISLISTGPDGNYVCISCGYSIGLKHNMKKHVETHIQTGGVTCRFCNKLFKTRNSLNTHTSVHHREEKKKMFV